MHINKIDEIDGQGGIAMLFSIPWWVFIVLLFICFSGYMSFRAAQAEKKLEQHFIEREGEIYMERMKQEKARRGESASE